MAAIPSDKYPLSKEVQALIGFSRSTLVPARITSTYRNRTLTLAGLLSNHHRVGTDGYGLAADYAGPLYRNHQQLLAIFNSFRSVEHKLAELIYAGAPYNIKDGKRVPRYAISSHYDHVHVAVRLGTLVAPLPITPPTIERASQMINKEAVAIRATASGRGYYVLATDGGIYSYGDAPFFGSLGDKTLNAPACDLALHYDETNGYVDGYWILCKDGGVNAFGRAPFVGAAVNDLK